MNQIPNSPDMRFKMAERFGNRFMKFMINSPIGGLMGKSMAVITVTGRKSGKPISTPINVVKEESTYYVISSRNRTWWRNLRGGAEASLRVAGKNHTVTGQVVESNEEVISGLIHLCKLMPAMVKYLNIKVVSADCLDEKDLNRVAAERVIIKLVDHQ
jgi:deazaflavin-dependent oxidoreductase (nitroreductase family)